MWIFRSLFIWRILLKILISSFVVMAGHQQAEYAEESELEGFPNVNPTIGQIWPHPQTIRSGGNIFLVDPFHFEFKVIVILKYHFIIRYLYFFSSIFINIFYIQYQRGQEYLINYVYGKQNLRLYMCSNLHSKLHFYCRP